jgi:hypothetical protein
MPSIRNEVANRMRILGLTRSIGMGKSTTAKLFAEAEVNDKGLTQDVPKEFQPLEEMSGSAISNGRWLAGQQDVVSFMCQSCAM